MLCEPRTQASAGDATFGAVESAAEPSRPDKGRAGRNLIRHLALARDDNGYLAPLWQCNGNIVSVYVTVDRVGRVVIPKALRVALGITSDTPLELIPDGSGLRIEPVRRRHRTIGTSDGLPILGDVEGAVLTDDDVRRLRDDIQR